MTIYSTIRTIFIVITFPLWIWIALALLLGLIFKGIVGLFFCSDWEELKDFIVP